MTAVALDFMRIGLSVGCFVIALACLRVAWRLATWSTADLIRWAEGDIR